MGAGGGAGRTWVASGPCVPVVRRGELEACQDLCAPDGAPADRLAMAARAQGLDEVAVGVLALKWVVLGGERCGGRRSHRA